MNVLVTGGAGFIGSHVVERLLDRQHTVTIVDDFNDFYDPAVKRRNALAFADHAEILEANIRDAASLRKLFGNKRFDTVIHLAARAGIRPSLAQPSLYTEVNVLGTQNLLEAAREFGVKKFIFASSSSVYGMNKKVPFAEDDPIRNPISPYAATKLAGEALCHVYHHLYGIDVACLRFFAVYGPRQRPDLAIHKFARAVSLGQPIELYGNGDTARDYTHIEDIMQGVLACLDREFGFEIINLGDSRTVRLLELVRFIEAALGKKAKIKSLPIQPGDVPITFANISKAKELLDYHPRIAIEQGIPDFVDWYRQQP